MNRAANGLSVESRACDGRAHGHAALPNYSACAPAMRRLQAEGQLGLRGRSYYRLPLPLRTPPSPLRKAVHPRTAFTQHAPGHHSTGGQGAKLHLRVTSADLSTAGLPSRGGDQRPPRSRSVDRPTSLPRVRRHPTASAWSASCHPRSAGTESQPGGASRHSPTLETPPPSACHPG